ncbi:RagB/SusD family nutrient uptake outer membrane protein [uncultured Parabacteroides sp.]|jgi:hypothetical protein|uniref:RagB/SusD family nutrient uptake outer membrane protein n=1 Tax=uncultured Parabacteroides sp. TaxID=512312 RepID=UPI0025FC1285|nr:RagB/SusD family nutrient uptake outer membrane protein [uncultured Parabacteroides sp.]
MKKIIYSIIAVLAFFFNACDFTDVTPEERLSDVNFWKSTTDLELYCNNFYTNFDAANPTYDKVSDNRYGNIPDNWLLDQVSNNDGTYTGNWNWETIKKANYFMTHYQTAEGTEADINQYVGEVRFFRAMDYFKKVKLFGDVPWFDKDLNINDTELLYKARDPRSMIVDKIIEDLEWAAANMKTKSKVTAGRLHNMAAYQMLARVCLHEGTYAKYHGTPGIDSNALIRKAAEAAKKVMDEGGFSIFKQDMPEMYKAVFKDPSLPQFDGKTFPMYYYSAFNQVDLTNNPEAVLCRIYITNVVMHNTPRVLAEWGVGMSKDLADSYLCEDGLPISMSPLYLGDDSITLEVLNRDPRMRQTFQNKTAMVSYDNGKVSVSGTTSVAPAANPGGYANMKFGHPDLIYQQPAGCDIDWYLFRYAEVLLIYAEAKAELGECTQDILDQTINQLRDRVDMAHLKENVGFTDPNWPNYGYTISPLLQEIRRERRIELVNEGFRYDDIIRWGAAEAIFNHNPKIMLGIVVNDDVIKRYPENTFGEGKVELMEIGGKKYVRPYPGLTTYKWTDRHYLYPLPQDQLQINKNLTQNPGWED